MGGRRRLIAITRASVTSSVRICLATAQPTTILENPSMIVARYAHPAQVRIYVISVNHNWSGPFGTNTRSTRSTKPPPPAPSRIVVVLYGLGCTQARPGRPGQPADPFRRMRMPTLRQFRHHSVDTQPTLVLLMDFLDELGEFSVRVDSGRRRPFLPRVVPSPGHFQHLTDQRNRDSFLAWLASLVLIHALDEGELHRLWLANHAAAFFKISRSIRNRRFSSSSSFSRARSSIVSGLSVTSPRFFAMFIQLPRVPSLIPSSRAISAAGRPELTTNSTASAL